MPRYERLFLLPILPVLGTVCDFKTLPVVSVPIRNVTFDDGASIERGLNLSVGTPPQPLAFVVNL